MPTAREILDELRSLGSETTRKTLRKHGLPEGAFGVKIGDMKVIQKRVKKDHALALALYDTGNADAQYLAGLLCDPRQMTEADLQRWADRAAWQMVGEYAVPWVAAESPFGDQVGRRWIDSPSEPIASSGWSTLSSLVSIRPDEKLDLPALRGLLDRVVRTIRDAPNRVRYCMNGFVISVGCYVTPLTDDARKAARAIGKVHVDVGDTDCKIPDALEYIAKVEARGSLGKKRKTAFC